MMGVWLAYTPVSLTLSRDIWTTAHTILIAHNTETIPSRAVPLTANVTTAMGAMMDTTTTITPEIARD